MDTRWIARGAALLALLSLDCRRAARARPDASPRAGTDAVLLDRSEILAAGGGVGRGESHDDYVLTVAAGDRIAVELTAPAFDPALEVTTPSGAALTNDDFAGDRHRSRVEFVTGTAGTLKVRVRSYQPGAAGAYRVVVQRVHAGAPVAPAVAQAALPANVPGASGYTAQAGAHLGRAHHQVPATAGTEIQVRQSVAGALAPDDGRLPSGELADVYQFRGRAAVPMTVELTSTALDPYLLVVGPNGELWENDDAGGTRNSLVTFQPGVDGVYRVVATSYRAGETGAYELQVYEGQRHAPQVVPAVAPQPGAVAGAQVITGALAAGDARLPSGEFADAHTFTWPAGARVRVEARSTAFDTYLIVRPPSGPQQDNDDAVPGNTNAAVDLVATVAGPYRVVVTSYRPGEQGPYELVVSAPGAGAQQAGGAAPQQPPVVAQGAAAGREVRGALAAGDARLPSGEWVDTHVLRFRAGESVQLRMSSTQLDPYLIVRTPSGRQLDNDDLVPGRPEAGVDIPAAEAGDYRVLATSYRPGETGAYVIRVERGGAQLPGQGGGGGDGGGGGAQLPGVVAGGGGAGNGGAGGQRVWGVFAGITDYPPGVNDLPECANDAVKMVESLTRRGLLAQGRYALLTDAQATTANVRDAMTRMASQVGPDDVFVFFYSGHGGRTQGGSADAREIDGMDEYLAVYDGRVMDDELGQLFDGIRARVSIVGIDSCFAGGFAKDVITRPGRVGLFSSEEDVTSDLAPRFQAGGYLSHFLRNGMAGEADNDPRDDTLAVGELTHYVWRQFGQHASDVRMSTGYQHLVVDRGAVGANTPLWSYAGRGGSAGGGR